MHINWFFEYPHFLFLIRRKRTIIIKNNAVPAYARKFVSGSGKKNKVINPRIITMGIR